MPGARHPPEGKTFDNECYAGDMRAAAWSNCRSLPGAMLLKMRYPA